MLAQSPNVHVVNARSLLSGVATGRQVLSEIDTRRTRIVPSNAAEIIQAGSPLGVGVSRKADDGAYDILVNVEQLTDNQIAHIIAHELQHIPQKIELDRLQSGSLFGMIDIYDRLDRERGCLGDHIKKGCEDLTTQDTQNYLLLIFATESPAYQVNLKLESEGLPFNARPLAGRIADYINAKYLPPFHLSPQQATNLYQQGLVTTPAELIQNLLKK